MNISRIRCQSPLPIKHYVLGAQSTLKYFQAPIVLLASLSFKTAVFFCKYTYSLSLTIVALNNLRSVTVPNLYIIKFIFHFHLQYIYMDNKKVIV